ncbi:LacI family transcriptional regulator [Arthrobacter sp. AG258]|uniref:LacI family DNA-binding transcriptional regulator n=1 Tax=Arthrobacter sp. AG258 TaxID=2183899 RepID=UPI0010D5F211|nr:LacI family DNA-binding transcriptional regulator [Arthrobacter sp. AG258]TDT74670.1 LacI family transcriptional regulator [Arthrobacter sp. AG258]
MAARITIKDIAERAGVSIGAVSFALNGRKGVSADTTARVLAVAEELGWAPSSAARSLTEAKSETFGLVLARDTSALGVESFFMQFIAGIESELTKRSYALLLQVVPDIAAEVETHRKWQASRRVDGLIVVDLRSGDPRLTALSRPGALPAVFSADPSIAGSLMNVWTDDASAMRECLSYLAAMGHRKVARVSGFSELGHTSVRDAAFREESKKLGLLSEVFSTDYSIQEGARATRAVLSKPDRATAIVYDNDIMAMSGLGVASEMGLSVPTDISLVAWDDSALCELTYPPLTAVSHDVVALGAHVARRLFDLIDGRPPGSYRDSVPTLKVRGSTAPPKRPKTS